MIQRKQSLFLLLAVVCGVFCMSLPVASVATPIEPSYTIYNLWVLGADASLNYRVSLLFVLQLLIASLSMYTIFRYNNRKQQMRYCSIGIACSLIWYVALGAFVFFYKTQLGDDASISFRSGSIMPLMIIILLTMAKRGIRHDEALVRAADRLR